MTRIVADSEVFGAEGSDLSTLQKIRLLIEWAPLLALLSKIPKAETNKAKALAMVAALRWLAKKTPTANDDKALDHLEAVISTPEGEAIVNFISNLAGALA